MIVTDMTVMSACFASRVTEATSMITITSVRLLLIPRLLPDSDARKHLFMLPGLSHRGVMFIGMRCVNIARRKNP